MASTSKKSDVIELDDDDDDVILVGVEKPKPVIIAVIDLDEMGQFPEDIIYDWHYKMCSSLLDADIEQDEDNGLNKVLTECQTTFQEMMYRFDSNDTLRTKMRSLIQWMHSYFSQMSSANSRSIDLNTTYYEKMEDLITMYVNLELNVLYRMKCEYTKKAKTTAIVHRTVDAHRRILHMMISYLNDIEKYVMHVLIRIKTNFLFTGNKELLNSIYNTILGVRGRRSDGGDDVSNEEAFCRAYIGFQKWKHARSGHSDNELDRLMYRIHDKFTPSRLRTSPLLRDTLIEPKLVSTCDIVASVTLPWINMSATYFEHDRIQRDLFDDTEYAKLTAAMRVDESGATPAIIDATSRTENVSQLRMFLFDAAAAAVLTPGAAEYAVFCSTIKQQLNEAMLAAADDSNDDDGGGDVGVGQQPHELLTDRIKTEVKLEPDDDSGNCSGPDDEVPSLNVLLNTDGLPFFKPWPGHHLSNYCFDFKFDLTRYPFETSSAANVVVEQQSNSTSSSSDNMDNATTTHSEDILSEFTKAWLADRNSVEEEEADINDDSTVTASNTQESSSPDVEQRESEQLMEGSDFLDALRTVFDTNVDSEQQEATVNQEEQQLNIDGLTPWLISESVTTHNSTTTTDSTKDRIESEMNIVIATREDNQGVIHSLSTPQNQETSSSTNTIKESCENNLSSSTSKAAVEEPSDNMEIDGSCHGQSVVPPLETNERVADVQREDSLPKIVSVESQHTFNDDSLCVTSIDNNNPKDQELTENPVVIDQVLLSPTNDQNVINSEQQSTSVQVSSVLEISSEDVSSKASDMLPKEISDIEKLPIPPDNSLRSPLKDTESQTGKKLEKSQSAAKIVFTSEQRMLEYDSSDVAEDSFLNLLDEPSVNPVDSLSTFFWGMKYYSEADDIFNDDSIGVQKQSSSTLSSGGILKGLHSEKTEFSTPLTTRRVRHKQPRVAFSPHIDVKEIKKRTIANNKKDPKLQQMLLVVLRRERALETQINMMSNTVYRVDYDKGPLSQNQNDTVRYTNMLKLTWCPPDTGTGYVYLSQSNRGRGRGRGQGRSRGGGRSSIARQQTKGGVSKKTQSSLKQVSPKVKSNTSPVAAPTSTTGKRKADTTDLMLLSPPLPTPPIPSGKRARGRPKRQQPDQPEKTLLWNPLEFDLPDKITSKPMTHKSTRGRGSRRGGGRRKRGAATLNPSDSGASSNEKTDAVLPTVLFSSGPFRVTDDQLPEADR